MSASVLDIPAVNKTEIPLDTKGTVDGVAEGEVGGVAEIDKPVGIDNLSLLTLVKHIKTLPPIEANKYMSFLRDNKKALSKVTEDIKGYLQWQLDKAGKTSYRSVLTAIDTAILNSKYDENFRDAQDIDSENRLELQNELDYVANQIDEFFAYTEKVKLNNQKRDSATQGLESEKKGLFDYQTQSKNIKNKIYANIGEIKKADENLNNFKSQVDLYNLVDRLNSQVELLDQRQDSKEILNAFKYFKASLNELLNNPTLENVEKVVSYLESLKPQIKISDSNKNIFFSSQTGGEIYNFLKNDIRAISNIVNSVKNDILDNKNFTTVENIESQYLKAGSLREVNVELSDSLKSLDNKNGNLDAFQIENRLKEIDDQIKSLASDYTLEQEQVSLGQEIEGKLDAIIKEHPTLFLLDYKKLKQAAAGNLQTMVTVLGFIKDLLPDTRQKLANSEFPIQILQYAIDFVDDQIRADGGKNPVKNMASFSKAILVNV